MFQRSIFFTFLLVLEVVYSLPIEEKIEPVELFHHCIEPEKDENEPDKSPVLLLHSLLGTHKNFDGIDRRIADRTKRRVCSVDLRNHGESPWNNKSDIAAFAVDVGHFLDEQNIKNVNIIGESLGGKIAVHYTLNNPDRVDSVITEDVRPNSYKQIAFMTVKFFVRILKNIIDSQPEGMDEATAKEWGIQRAAEIFKTVKNIDNIPEDLSKYIDLHFIGGKWTLKHNLDLLYEKIKTPKEVWIQSTGLYTGPTMFIYGTESPFKVGDDKEEILKLFPNAVLAPIEGAGHVIHELHPEFEDIVVKFLNEIK